MKRVMFARSRSRGDGVQSGVVSGRSRIDGQELDLVDERAVRRDWPLAACAEGELRRYHEPASAADVHPHHAVDDPECGDGSKIELEWPLQLLIDDRAVRQIRDVVHVDGG